MMAGRPMDVNSGNRNRYGPGRVASDVKPDDQSSTGPASPPRSQAESAARMASLQKAAAKEFRSQQHAERRSTTKRKRGRSPWWRTGLLVLALALLPFFTLVRVSVWTYASFGAPTWLALGAGALLTLVIVGLYGARISARLTGKARFRLALTHVALPITLVYCGYTLVYLSSTNAKNEAVRTYYTTLHPIFRLALSTAVLFDHDLVVTDVRRIPSDYIAMGLPVYEASLHFKQSDGFVHAVDLRTIGRPPWRTTLMTGYFRLMGFRTLRHIGTADHLHVSLPMRE